MPSAKNNVVLVAGGTGFVGKRVVALLEKKDYRVIVHHRQRKAIPTHADIIVNLVGIIREDDQTYKDAHVDFTAWLVRLGKKPYGRQFVEMCAIGADAKGTAYQRSKAQAEEIVKNSSLPYAIVRPSMIFGADDKSINMFRRVARTGFFPLFANGTTQPVSVDTVAQVVVAAVENRIRNRTVEVGGPEIFTYDQLLDRIHPGGRTFKARILTGIATTLGEWFIALPTKEQVTMLSQDNTTKYKTVDSPGIKNPRLK